MKSNKNKTRLLNSMYHELLRKKIYFGILSVLWQNTAVYQDKVQTGIGSDDHTSKVVTDVITPLESGRLRTLESR